MATKPLETSTRQSPASGGGTESVRPSRSGPAGEANRVPPQDIEAERSLLGSMMLSNEAVENVLPIISRDDSDRFYRHDHQLLFELLIDLYDAKQPIDLILVKNELLRRDQLEQVGGVEYIVQLAESVPSWVNAEFYARIVRDKAMLRDLISCSGRILEQAYAAQDDAKDVLDHAEQQLFAVTDQRITNQAVQINEIVEAVFHQIQIRGEHYITGLPTGFHELDDKTTGLQSGEMIIIAARPSMGKTAIALCMAEHMAA